MRIHWFSGWNQVFLHIWEYCSIPPTTSPTPSQRRCSTFPIYFYIISINKTHYADANFASKFARSEQPTSAQFDHPSNFNYLETVFTHYFYSFSLNLHCISIIPNGSFQLHSVLEIDTSSVFRPFLQHLSQLPVGLTQHLRQHFWTQHNQFNGSQPLIAHSLANIHNLRLNHPKPHFWDQFSIANFSQINLLAFFGGVLNPSSNTCSLAKIQCF